MSVEHEYECRLTKVEERSKSNSHRLDEVERRQDDLDKLVSSVSVLAAKQEQVETDVKEMKADVKTLIGKPARRWDAMVDKVLWAVAAAVIAFVLGRVGL